MPNGYIYRLTSPSGKKYIGQTIHECEKRWNSHHQSAIGHKDASPILEVAIRKYGFDNFTKEIVIECDITELDLYEITVIKDENTITPNGYNIRPGGRYSYSDLPVDLQQFYSNNIRIHKNFDLPPGLVEINLPHRG